MNIKRWLTGIGVIAFLSVSTMIIADQADTLDLHSNVKEAVGIADVSSAVCLEISASGEASVVESSAAAIAVDLAALEVLLTASNVDLAAIEVLNTAIQTAVETVPAKTGTVAAADAQVKASAGTVYAVLVSGIGVTAADKIEIKNSTDNAGDALITIVADAANGTWAFYPCVGITYDTGIYCDETKSGGTFTVTIVSE